MREQKKAKVQEHLENFEEIYIRTYQEFYEYVRILITDQKKSKGAIDSYLFQIIL